MTAARTDERCFIVAHNPDGASRLPFLLRLPLSPPLWLKAGGTWPSTSRVYCHPVQQEPVLAQLRIEDCVVAVVCRARGTVIDLVLDRASRRRSQFVLTTARGRRAIFWQSASAILAAPPGLRIPTSGSSQLPMIVVDTRERFAYAFAHYAVATERATLPVGDYAAVRNGRCVGVVERKTLNDFADSLVNGSLAFAMAELASFTAAVVVECTYAELLRYAHTSPGFLPELVLRLQLRYREVPINLVGCRKIAEYWTYRFLRAAYAAADTPPRR